MPTAPDVRFPLHFLAREEVRLFIGAMKFHAGCEESVATASAFLLVMDFGSQGKDWRVLKGQWPNGKESIDWNAEPLGLSLRGVAGPWVAAPSEFMRASLESGMVEIEDRAGILGLACPIFKEFNAHLLPGFVPFHKKGQQAAQRKREGAQDPLIAKQQLQLINAQGSLDLGELSGDIEAGDIEAAIMVIMRIDRAGGMPTRKASEFATWMIGATVRLMREHGPSVVQKLIEFLFEARMDPTVPKGAEQVLNGLLSARLLERSQL
jgi:hypothetical protein